ncbi:MAG: NAD-dependent epimerase/dehydratase family protein [Thaumarchaeota archaeon]|nr:NAD-dependent epimerase/dehydratase family protein [Nitrososphaerota archaeon]
MSPSVLVTGAAGQIGTELVRVLRKKYGTEGVTATDKVVRPGSGPGTIVPLDVTDRASVERAFREHAIDTVYHLAAVLSALGEENPDLAWDVNMKGLKNVLDSSAATGVRRLFWPSSIGVFGPDAPKMLAPQDAPLNPTTMYGVTKVAGELLCRYYSLKHDLDVRSLRYPGLISSEAKPGGGTTDYAVEIFYSALKSRAYTCFLRQDTALPMMYMPDALRATVQLMEADRSSVKLHGGYNLSAMSFTPAELSSEIQKRIPGFSVAYAPDQRQKIADSWPMSIDDSAARRDWGWKPEYDLPSMAADMLARLGSRLQTQKDV